MPYFTCDCGHRRHVHPAYMPAPGEEAPLVCTLCKKEWTITASTRGEIDAEPVKKDPPPGTLPRRRAKPREF